MIKGLYKFSYSHWRNNLRRPKGETFYKIQNKIFLRIMNTIIVILKSFQQINRVIKSLSTNISQLITW